MSHMYQCISGITKDCACICSLQSQVVYGCAGVARVFHGLKNTATRGNGDGTGHVLMVTGHILCWWIEGCGGCTKHHWISLLS